MPRPARARERVPWLDAVRGLAVLAMLPLAAEGLLHPRAEALRGPAIDPTLQPVAWAAWVLLHAAGRQTPVWLLAICAGAGLALAREARDDPEWTMHHRARWLLLLAAALCFQLAVWPSGPLAGLPLAALLLAAPVRDSVARPLWPAIAAGAAPIILAVWEMEQWARYVDASGQTWADIFQPSNPDYDRWESAAYAGDWRGQAEVHLAHWRDRTARALPLNDLWHAGAGLLAGVWWMRQGRHRNVAPRVRRSLAASGTLACATAAALATGESTGLALRIAGLLDYAGAGVVSISITACAARADASTWRTPVGTLLQRAGRRSLSIFAFTTTLLAAIGHGWGLGLHGRLDFAQTAAATASAIAVALAMSLPADDRWARPLETWWRRAAGRLVRAAR